MTPRWFRDGYVFYSRQHSRNTNKKKPAATGQAKQNNKKQNKTPAATGQARNKKKKKKNVPAATGHANKHMRKNKTKQKTLAAIGQV